ncbi:diacylglycerol kinase family protein [Alkalibacterium sp. MB6]|uniref:diacylglycerol kinase family protein n=1 Tax=Alkalibacterium sp. MB6 TaxID=2081965 RepID=UPI001379A45E|nr:diacylglycerol kinase family protein [Alkalibacterium sp. MB6]
MGLEEKPNLPSKNRRYRDSFHYAFKGIKTVFQEERNMKVHVAAGVFMLLFSLFLPLTKEEWLWILLVSYLVFVMEIINTVVENLVDLVTNEFHPIAKKVKDMAAAVVLVTATFAVLVGALIILPKLWQLIN